MMVADVIREQLADVQKLNQETSEPITGYLIAQM
jgi:hypothetical protein